MPDEEISLDSPPAKRVNASANNRNAFVALSLGFLAAASILLLIYQSNRALQLGIDAAEVSSDYQTKSLKTTIEEDPNLKKQYTEEQDVLLKHAVELRETSKRAKDAMRLSGYVAVLFLLGTAAAVVALLARTTSMVYVGILLGIIGLGLAIKTLL
jgi:Flp pilus assembly protein TadB